MTPAASCTFALPIIDALTGAVLGQESCWEVSAEAEAELTTLDAVPDGMVVANTELELTPDEARALGTALLRAADEALSRDGSS